MDPKPQSGRIALLVTALALTGLVVAIWGAMVMRSSDAAYSRIVDVNTRILGDLQALTSASANVHRHSLNLLLAQSASEVQSRQEEIGASWKENDARLANILQLARAMELEPLAARLKQNRDAYRQAHASFLEMLSKPSKDEALACRTNLMRPTFDAYQSAQSELAERAQSSADKASDAATARSKSMQRILIGFASWPFLLAVGATVVSIVWFILLFRHLPNE